MILLILKKLFPFPSYRHSVLILRRQLLQFLCYFFLVFAFFSHKKLILILLDCLNFRYYLLTSYFNNYNLAWHTLPSSLFSQFLNHNFWWDQSLVFTISPLNSIVYYDCLSFLTLLFVFSGDYYQLFFPQLFTAMYLLLICFSTSQSSQTFGHQWVSSSFFPISFSFLSLCLRHSLWSLHFCSWWTVLWLVVNHLITGT